MAWKLTPGNIRRKASKERRRELLKDRMRKRYDEVKHIQISYLFTRGARVGRDLFFLLIDPLQLEVKWYKIQNIEEQKNVPDSKTKHN